MHPRAPVPHVCRPRHARTRSGRLGEKLVAPLLAPIALIGALAVFVATRFPILYPAALDDLSNPGAATPMNGGARTHSQQHGDANDVLEAIEAKLGVGVSLASAATVGATLTRKNDGSTGWVVPIADRLDVRRYGAIGDGVSHPLSGYFGTLAAAQAVYASAAALTDELDNVAIDKAVQDAGNNIAAGSGPGTVYVPSGTYIINKGITVNRDYVRITGDGKRASVLKMKAPQPSATADVLTIKKAANAVITGVIVDHLGFDGNKVAVAKTGDAENELINGSMTVDLTVAFCRFLNGQSDGIDLDGSCPGVRIINNDFEGLQRCGVHLYGPYNGLVQGNRYSNCGNEWVSGVSVSAAPSAVDIVFDQSAAAIAAFPGVGIAATGLRIIGNWIDDCLMGVRCSAKGPIIADNFISRTNGSAADTVVGHAIRVTNAAVASGAVIVNNVIDTCRRDGISSDGTIIGNRITSAGQSGIAPHTAQALVEGNVVASAGTDGIAISSAALGTIVRGNRVLSPVNRGIAMLGGADHIVEGNYLEGHGGIGIYVLTSTSQFRNNRIKGGPSYGIQVIAGVTDCAFDGNTITSTLDHGLYVQGTRCTVRNNTIRGVTTANKAGIATTSSDGAAVIGNHSTGNYWGILVGSGSANHTVTNNHFTGNTFADISTSGSVGAGGVVINNRTTAGYA